MYTTLSPVFTSSASLVWALVSVVPLSKLAVFVANAFKSACVYTGSLLVVGATPLIAIMNFLNAKSNSGFVNVLVSVPVYVWFFFYKI